MAITQQTLDAARAKARSLGMSEFGYVNGGSEVHPDWQALSDASGQYANAILALGGVDWSLDRVNQNIVSHPDVQAWLDRFVTPETPKASELRVGDVIRLVAGGSWGSHREGGEHTIGFVSDDHASTTSGWTLYDNEEDNAAWPFELVRRASEPAPEPATLEQALAEGRYHADLFPIFEKWSEEAQTAGYCAEYDRLVRSIGAPTRAEVRAIVAQRDGRRRRVTVPVTVHLTYETEGPVTSDQDAVEEMRSKMTTWPDIADLVAENIRTERRSAIPTGGTIPTEGRVVTAI